MSVSKNYQQTGQTHKYTAVSFFCGSGGLDLGFTRAGFDTLWANDFDSDSCETYRKHSSAVVICGDMHKIGSQNIPDCDVMLGGFPCQGFSLSGPRKVDDSRNTLYKEYVRLVKTKRPLAFIGENVKGLLTMASGAFINAIVSEFSDCGYNVYYQHVNAKDYGVPQDRVRIFIVGFRKDLHIESFSLPKYTGKQHNLTDALATLPKPKETDICHEPYSSRYMSRNRKRQWNEVSYTIPAMAKQVPLYPDSPDMVKLDTDLWRFGDGGDTRRLSWQECAAIQTFPTDMEFVGDLTSKYKQIGNAVPVNLAEQMATAIREVLDNIA